MFAYRCRFQINLRSDSILLKRLKKIVAGISALVIMATATACGSDTKWAVQYDDYEARAGIFLFYQMSAYYDAISIITEEDSEFDTTDTKALKSATVEDTPIVEWIQNDTTEKVKIYLEVLKEFDELGLSLTEDELSTIDTITDTYWEYYSEYYTTNGIGEESFRDINTYSYKRDAVFNYYYAEGGVEEVDEQELKDYYEKNNARVKYICLNSTDSDGNFLDTEMETMAEDFVTRANNGEDFDTLIDEYEQYKEDLSAEQEAEAEAEAESETESADGTIESTSANSSNSTDDTTIGDSLSESEEVSTDTETEEEEDPYPNEYVVTKSEDETSGSPTYKVNQEIFGHSNYGDAFLVEEDSAYYVVVRYDIWERDDLWTDDTKATILSTLYSDKFDEKMLDAVDDDLVTLNDKAYKRYNPLDMEF